MGDFVRLLRRKLLLRRQKHTMASRQAPKQGSSSSSPHRQLPQVKERHRSPQKASIPMKAGKALSSAQQSGIWVDSMLARRQPGVEGAGAVRRRKTSSTRSCRRRKKTAPSSQRWRTPSRSYTTWWSRRMNRTSPRPRRHRRRSTSRRRLGPREGRWRGTACTACCCRNRR